MSAGWRHRPPCRWPPRSSRSATTACWTAASPTPSPIRFFESIGYKRNLIILTQPKSFVKKKNPLLPAIRARYLRYPAFVEAVADRHERYNETLSYISMLEQAGADYVIRPPIPLEIGAMERDPDQLRRVYETGRAVAQIQIDKIKAFLDAAKAEPET